MSQPVTIENADLKLEVWPQFGGKVTSIIDRADGYELLANYPQELPTRCQYAMTYADAWFGGWDECFPAIAPGAYPLHPYEGINIPDHGEIWSLPTTAVPTRDGITTVWHGLRFGYRLTRKLYLEDASIISEYTLINLAPFEFRFCWGLGSLLSMQSPMALELENMKLTSGRQWPNLDDQTAFLRTDELPAGSGWQAFSEAPITAPAKVLYPARGRELTIEYSSDTNVTGYWGIDINTGNSSGRRHLAVAPLTGRSNQLQAAISDNSAASVGPMGRSQWRAILRVDASRT